MTPWVASAASLLFCSSAVAACAGSDSSDSMAPGSTRVVGSNTVAAGRGAEDHSLGKASAASSSDIRAFLLKLVAVGSPPLPGRALAFLSTWSVLDCRQRVRKNSAALSIVSGQRYGMKVCAPSGRVLRQRCSGRCPIRRLCSALLSFSAQIVKRNTSTSRQVPAILGLGRRRVFPGLRSASTMQRCL